MITREQSEELSQAAEQTLSAFDTIAHAARARLNAVPRTPGDALAVQNAFTSEKAYGRLGEVERTEREVCERLAREPAIARVVVQDEQARREVIYVARAASPTGGTLKVASYRSNLGRLASLEPDDDIEVMRGGKLATLTVIERALLRPEENRIETPRRTTLRSAGASVEMVEHILAALAGLHIDNCEVWVDAAEMPGCDGSSQPFVAALDSVGTVTQQAVRSLLVVHEITRLGDEDSWIEARPAAAPGMSAKYRLDYGRENAIGRQTLAMTITPDAFRRELAPSRTFMLKAEADWLRGQGLGKRVTSQDLLVFDDLGPVDNELRYADECVRHKLLDLVGDLALAGCDLMGHFVAHRSGHRLNAELVRVLLAEGEVVRGWRKTA